MTLSIPTAGLVLLLTPPTGVTASGGLVSAVADQSGQGNDATQATAGLKPFTTGESVEFEYLWNELQSDKLAVSNLTLDRRAFSIFAVVSPQVARPAGYDGSNIIQDGCCLVGGSGINWHFGAASIGGAVTGPAFYAVHDGVSRQASTLKPLSSPQFVGIVGSSDSCVLYVGNESYSINPLTAGQASSLLLGSNVSDLLYGGGLHCLAAYSRAVPADEITASIRGPMSAYGMVPASGMRVVFDGDSNTTGGHGEELNRSWVNALSCMGGIEYATTAIAGATYSSNSNFSLNTTAAVRVDSYLANGRNVLVIFAGTNDMVFGRTPAQTWADLQTYIPARFLAGWDYVLVGTCMSRDSIVHGSVSQANVDSYNTLIRNGYAATGARLIDFASDADLCGEGVTEDEDYFIQGIHPTAAAAVKMAAIADPVVTLAVTRIRAASATATKIGSGAATATQINQFEASAERKS